MTPDLYILCDLCTRGIVHNSPWGEPCKVCLGRGSLTLARVCRLLGENESTVVKLLKPRRRMRVKTAARLLDKLCELIEPKELTGAPPLELEEEFTDGERRQLRCL
ncbi:MAG: hypothetical protein LUO93_00440 [Methanomicrobiales archaeon]|nr:hypothetical protein [Methanomicrobiales archaeon]